MAGQYTSLPTFSVTASNPSVGTVGSAAPANATEVAGVNPGGQLQPLQVDASKNLLVNVQSTVLPTGASTSALQSSVQGSVSGGTAATSSNLVGGVYTTTPPALTNNQQAAARLDVNGNLKTSPNAVSDVTGSGTITANAQTIQIGPFPGSSSWSIQLSGTFSAGTNIGWQVSDDGTTWIGVNGRQTGTGNGTAILATSVNGPGPFTYRGNLAGTSFFRVICNSFQAGDAVAVQIHASQGVGAVFLNSAIPGGVNVIGKIGIDQTTPGTTNAVQVIAALPTGSNTIGSIKVTDGTNTGAVKAASTAAVATDPAIVVALSPNNNTLGNALFMKNSDGTNVAAVKAASTAPVAADPALVVTMSPNSPASARQTGTFTDRSGTTSGTPSTSTQVAASNASRKYFIIVNSSPTNTIWINFTTAAVATQPSIPLQPYGSFVMEQGFVTTEAINVLCTVASSPFSAKEA